MLTQRQVDKLRSVRAPEASVLSLYLTLPPDQGSLRDIPARAAELIARAAAGSVAAGSVAAGSVAAGSVAASLLSAEDEQLARGVLAARGQEWLGQTVAIFACAQIGLLEAVPLPCTPATSGSVEHAVVAVRPHVRPLLAALQRSPAHWIVVIDDRDAWLLAVAEDGVEPVGRVPGHGGWYGPASYHAGQRLTDLARYPYRDAAALLTRIAGPHGRQPLVIGGRTDGIRDLLAELPDELRASYAGCFTADADSLTLVRARDLAAPVIAHWCEQRERALVSELIFAAADGTTSPPGTAVAGLTACLAAVAASRAGLLLVRDDAMVPGYHCERCDALSLSSDGCADWGAASRPVPDLLEEMVRKTLADGGDVVSARSVPSDVAARLR
jgi:Bacterial archaeo-eukaryotic release factor family 10